MEVERRIPMRGPAEDGSKSKRRKVRKGTRSCWECRRRKIRCLYPSQDASVCANCTSRGTNCVSQEFPDEQTPATDQRVTQRLGRVEEMLERLIEQILPDSYTTGPVGSKTTSPASPASPDTIDPDSVDNERRFSPEKPPVLATPVSLPACSKAATPDWHSSELEISESHHEIPIPNPKHEEVSRKLYTLFPCQHDVDIIAKTSPGRTFVVGYFAKYRDIIEGQCQDPLSISIIPDVGSHPVMLAKRLMQLTNCIQQLPPSAFYKLSSIQSPRCVMAKYSQMVLELVAYNDDLVGYVEGLETLSLLSLYHANVGNLRKAWLIIRRALSIAQLMGVDRYGDKPLRSADPASDPRIRPKAKTLWFRLNFLDRYLSLTLGLAAGADDNSFLAEDPRDEPTDRLEKQHTVVMGAIIKRNSHKGTNTSFGMTHEIDCDLEKAARRVTPEFWHRPSADSLANAGSEERLKVITRSMLHMHHYNLLILLHLPFMLRDPKERRWDYSKATCTSSSRQLLQTFLLFREINNASSSCRHTEYSALTAALTLLLSYLDPKLQSQDPVTTSTRLADRALIEKSREKLMQMAERNDDKICLDAANLISRLFPLLDPELMTGAVTSTGNSDRASSEAPTIRLEIPYLGTIHINPMSASSDASRASDLPPTPNPDSNTDITSGIKELTANDDLNADDYQIFPAPNQISSWNPPSQPAFPPAGTETTHLIPAALEYTSTNSTEYGDFFNNFAFEWSQAQLAHPELAAEVDQWTFQGFDTTYFESLFLSSAQASYEP
ncbi:hypothetical protein GGR50DRAFT_413260 [Xylaria sp. CBS 124048]|nr:hypothetical protein GGR50DRAFT_413260 [Xylaria sp. CBS 124048]